MDQLLWSAHAIRLLKSERSLWLCSSGAARITGVWEESLISFVKNRWERMDLIFSSISAQILLESGRNLWSLLTVRVCPNFQKIIGLRPCCGRKSYHRQQMKDMSKSTPAVFDFNHRSFFISVMASDHRQRNENIRSSSAQCSLRMPRLVVISNWFPRSSHIEFHSLFSNLKSRLIDDKKSHCVDCW